ncbi:hypothetical protein E5A73_18765 [Sphingomonas gei]|uniref:Uncharacterized protein n=1 Tax=Sphingomonas gei TaxID=1395960 RepID=A0A4S1X4S3_9SPHN|nr:hypothetical protein [Sphingomonas gei]TGX50445.1 hypothetical protein E5A73_18765 [Sphingomonas gei]
MSASARFSDPEQGFYVLTVQWSIISESLTHSLDAKGEHGYGSLIRGRRGSLTSFHHNLWANHAARMPRPGNYDVPEIDPIGPLVDFRSNVSIIGAARIRATTPTRPRARYNFIDNAYVAGPQSKKPVAFDESTMLAKAWFAGNSMNGGIPAGSWSFVTAWHPRAIASPHRSTSGR